MSRSRRASALHLLALTSLAPAAASAQPIVRPVHPRLFMVADGRRGISPATMVARCEASSSPYARACRAAAPPLPLPGTVPSRTVEHPLIALATRYVLYQEPATLQAVREQVAQVGAFVDRGDPTGQYLTNARAVRQLAVAYDWLYAALPAEDRATLESFLRSYAEWSVTHEPADVFSAEAYAHGATVALAALALSGASTVPEADVRRYLAYADTRWKTQLLPALAYTRGWWHEGPGWFTGTALRNAALMAAAWTTATDEDLFAHARTHGDVFGLSIRYLAYVLRPDFRFAAFGDSTDAQLSPANQLRPVLDLLAWGTGSPLAQSLAAEATRRLPAASDYNGPEIWQQLVFYSPERPAMPARDALPLAAHLGATSEDVVVMRSSWDDTTATWVSLSCGDWFSARQHLEAGSFQIFRRDPLAISTGTFDGFETAHWLNWSAQRSIHSNVVTITRPGELFPNGRMLPMVNDGGQRSIAYASGGRRTLDEYRNNLTSGAQFETGGITAFEASRFHDYAACDSTRAYNSVAYATQGNTAKVREVTRQLVFLRPELVVVFDRVESTDPSYVKRFVLHGPARPLFPSLDTFTIDGRDGRLLGRRLLPTSGTQGLVEGFRVDGMDFAPLVMGNEARGARVEDQSSAPAAREYFLHLLEVGQAGRSTLPMSSLVEEGDRVGLRVTDPDGSRAYTVLFARTGMTTGEIRVADRNGAPLYQGTLGAGGTFYAPVTDAGVGPMPTDAGVDAGAAAMDGGFAMDGGMGAEPVGCSCRVGSAQGAKGAGAMWLLGAAAVALGRRRRRGG
jgi:MYXO-CTERM domain-containing protein